MNAPNVSGMLMLILPEVVLSVGAMITLLLGVSGADAGRSHRAAMAALATAVVGVVLAIGMLTGAPLAPGTTFIANDGFRWTLTALLCAGTGAAVVLTEAYDRRAGVARAETPALLLLAATGMTLLTAARDLMVVFLGIELMSLATYVLVAMHRTSARAAEAAVKYFLLGAFSTAFLLYGIALVYGATGSMQLEGIGSAVASGAKLPGLLMAGVALMLVGLAFKVAAAPFHLWTPDVYDGAPTAVTGFMAASVKAAAFAIFLRITAEAFAPLLADWHPVLWVLAAATMVIGNVLALGQQQIKRVLAYSSIAHAGYLLVAVVSFSAEGATALVFYLVAYTLATMGAFAVLVALSDGTDRPLVRQDLAGLRERHPWLALAFAVCVLSMLGFPLAGGVGFFAKWQVLQAALQASVPQQTLAIVLVLSSVVSGGYYLGLIAPAFMQSPVPAARPIPAPPTGVRAIAIACAVVVLVLGVLPSSLTRLAQRSAPSAFAGGPTVATTIQP
ncbi:MAG: NADH-quinone oxidoreductase subunit N [Gemmatimonadaceae bacterium]|jgi:NADH-quinone oxidoreductase subunit N|nr:NADH-quinone oxidoreductase subunit N [Gemmatimonadaceae bacterium]